MKIEIKENNISKRLDVFLLGEINESRSFISKHIKLGNILVNNNLVKAGYLLKENDVVEILELKEEIKIKESDIKLDIVYEDKDIIVVNKPSGLVVHPAPGNMSGTLVNALLKHTNLSSESGVDRPGIVHRIDKDTSGLLLVAKTSTAHNFLSQGFKNKTIKRKYIALVHGIIDTNKGKIVAPIGRDVINRKRLTVTDKNSKEAITYFTVLERLNNASLVELTLETGRTHQIRVHMEYINHPVVNDPLYGKFKPVNKYGQLLHAYYIGFNHPITGEFMEFSSPLESEFNSILETFKSS